jgi:hypothetical protein
MHKILTGRLAALALLGGAEPALAQQAQGQAAPPTSQETVVIASVDVRYDSNVAKSDREVAAERGLTLADAVFTPEVNFILARQIGTELLFLQGEGSYLFHAHDTLLDRQALNVDGGVVAHLARCQEVPTGSFSSQQIDLDSVTEIRVSNTVDIGSVGVTVNCGGAIGFAPQVGVTQTWRDNSSIEFEQADSHTLTATGSLAYRSPVFGSVSLFGNYLQTTFPHYLISPNTSQAYGFVLYAGGVTFDRHLGGRIEGTASISFTDLEPNSSISSPFRGLTYSVEGTYHLNYRINFHALLSRATLPSNQVGADYSLNQTYEADVSYKLGSRITLTLTGSHIDRTYDATSGLLPSEGVQPVVLTNSSTDDELGTLTYTLNRHISVSLYAGEEDRKASSISYNYSSTRVGLTLTATY